MTPCPHARPLPHLPCPYPGCHARTGGPLQTVDGVRYVRVPTYCETTWRWHDFGQLDASTQPVRK